MRNTSVLLLILLARLRAEQFLHHDLTLDAAGNIVSWLPPPAGAAFSAFAVRSAYWFAHQVPDDPATGLPIYYTHGQIPFVHWPHTPSRFTSWAVAAGATLLAYAGDDVLARHRPAALALHGRPKRQRAERLGLARRILCELGPRGAPLPRRKCLFLFELRSRLLHTGPELPR